jgi:anti-sigma factor RsiW
MPTAHRQVLELLPWYVSGQIDDAQRAAVELHMHTCAQCRSELQRERELRGAYINDSVSTEPGDADVDVAFARMQQMLAQPADVSSHRLGQSWRALSTYLTTSRRGFGYALLAQCAVIAVFGWTLFTRVPIATDYRALASVAASPGESANVVVVFDPGIRELDMRRILHSAHARVVGGPTLTNAYLLTVAPDAQDAALKQLRSEASVRLAESLTVRP